MVAFDDYDFKFEREVDEIRNKFQAGWIRWLQKAGPTSLVAEIYQQCMTDLDQMRREGLRSLPALYNARKKDSGSETEAS